MFHHRRGLPYRMIACFIAVVFSLTPPMAGQAVYGQMGLQLPPAGTMVTVSPAYVPPMLKGLILHPENPFQFDFIFDSGDAKLNQEQIKEESTKLIKYFLTSLTIPEEELWVNLSPYEKDRIIPDAFGQTEMGRDLLAQDYMLKQLTASLMYPEDDLGEEFWNQIYEKAYQAYGTTEIPVNTFNKVWILPEKAVVYENEDTAFVVESRLKVMIEEDYVALRNEMSNATPLSEAKGASTPLPVATDLLREIILPEIEREVNEGKNFAQLRQIYASHILATWYKMNLKDSILNQKYSDQKKVLGLEVEDKDSKQKIYDQYIEAFKDGVYNYIKEDYDPATQQIIMRKYFSGGTDLRVSSSIEITKQRPSFSSVGDSSYHRINSYQVPSAIPPTASSSMKEEKHEGKITIGTTGDPHVDPRSEAQDHPIYKFIEKRGNEEITIVEVGTGMNDKGIPVNIVETARKFPKAKIIGLDLNIPTYVFEFPGPMVEILNQDTHISTGYRKYIAYFEVIQDPSGQVIHKLNYVVGKGEAFGQSLPNYYPLEDRERKDMERRAEAARDDFMKKHLGSDFKNREKFNDLEDIEEGETKLFFEPMAKAAQGIPNLRIAKGGFELSTVDQEVDMIRLGNVMLYYNEEEVKKYIEMMGKKVKEGGEIFLYERRHSYLTYEKIDGVMQPQTLSVNLRANSLPIFFYEQGSGDSGGKIAKIQFPQYEQLFQDTRSIIDKEIDYKGREIASKEVRERIKKELEEKGYQVSLDEKQFMHIGLASSSAVGGIDLRPEHMDIQRQGTGINVSSPVNLENMQNIEIWGLTPFIFSITPIQNLPALLGAAPGEQEGFEVSSMN